MSGDGCQEQSKSTKLTKNYDKYKNLLDNGFQKKWILLMLPTFRWRHSSGAWNNFAKINFVDKDSHQVINWNIPEAFDDASRRELLFRLLSFWFIFLR